MFLLYNIASHRSQEGYKLSKGGVCSDVYPISPNRNRACKKIPKKKFLMLLVRHGVENILFKLVKPSYI